MFLFKITKHSYDINIVFSFKIVQTLLFIKSKKIISLFILFLTIGYFKSFSSQNQLDYKVMMGYQG